MNSPKKSNEQYDHLVSTTSADRKSKRGSGKSGKKSSNVIHRRKSEAPQSELAKGRKGKLNYLSDATPPPELGENLNA